MAIIDAILAGERDPKKLAKLRNHRIKADEATIAKSLVGDYKEEHLFTLQQAVDLYRYHGSLIEACDKKIETLLEMFESQKDEESQGDQKRSKSKKTGANDLHFDIRSHLHRIYGVDLTEIPGISGLTAHTIFTEIGMDIHKFTTVHHFTSWPGLSPNNKVSGGKVLSSKTSFSSNRVAKAFRMAANALYNSKSYLGDHFRKMRSRLGAPKAITAVAHKLARIVYAMLMNRTPYDESIFAVEAAKHREKRLKKLKKQVAEFGLELVESQANPLPESA